MPHIRYKKAQFWHNTRLTMLFALDPTQSYFLLIYVFQWVNCEKYSTGVEDKSKNLMSFEKKKIKICVFLSKNLETFINLLCEGAASCCRISMINAQVLCVIGVGALTRLSAPMTKTFQDGIVRSSCCSGFHLGLQGRSWSPFIAHLLLNLQRALRLHRGDPTASHRRIRTSITQATRWILSIHLWLI